jgi:hypothetical protein
MDSVEIPKLRDAFLSERFMLAIDPEMKRGLMELKYTYGVDITEWIRRMVRSELPKLREQLSELG